MCIHIYNKVHRFIVIKGKLRLSCVNAIVKDGENTTNIKGSMMDKKTYNGIWLRSNNLEEVSILYFEYNVGYYQKMYYLDP